MIPKSLRVLDGISSLLSVIAAEGNCHSLVKYFNGK
jgi:hypothetical protein